MYAKKSLGQHFLTNPTVVQKMIAAGNVTEKDTVFEIGPGTGILTGALLETGARVVAVEADLRAITILEELFHKEIKAGQLQLTHGDMRTLAVESLGFTGGGYKVIANIPYYISGLLFEKILSCSTKPSDLVFLVQKEVAERIARSKKESLLSLSIKAYGTPRYITTVAKGNFNPPPKIDSAVLLVSDITQVSDAHFTTVRETDFFNVLKTGFKAKRKQLLGNLTTYDPKITRADLVEIFSTLEIPLDARGEDLSIETWLKLTYTLTINTK